MKKRIILSVILFTAVVSCKKEETTPCNCGEIMSDNAADYSVDIKNDCSGNFKTWILTPDDWMSAYVGTHYCITNTTSW
jgi:hypothetical protein